MRLAPVSPRPVATTRKQPPLTPPLDCQTESSCDPCTNQPESPLSKVLFGTRLPPPCGITSTLSTRHSPSPSRKS